MIKYIRDLKRRFDHVKVIGNDEIEEYKPAMIIYKPSLLACSFQITIDAIWKYIDPIDNTEPNTISLDVVEFNKILIRNELARKLLKINKPFVTIDGKIIDVNKFFSYLLNQPTLKEPSLLRSRLQEDILSISFAKMVNLTMRIMYCTGYNLANCMQMFGIDPEPHSAIQLMLWIQEGLDDLKNMPEALPENKVFAGEVTMVIDGKKITKDIELTETDLITGE